MVIRMSIQSDGTILAGPNYQGSPSSEAILSTLTVPELGGCFSKARFLVEMGVKLDQTQSI